jgi:hypothetical protein
MFEWSFPKLPEALVRRPIYSSRSPIWLDLWLTRDAIRIRASQISSITFTNLRASTPRQPADAS